MRQRRRRGVAWLSIHVRRRAAVEAEMALVVGIRVRVWRRRRRVRRVRCPGGHGVVGVARRQRASHLRQGVVRLRLGLVVAPPGRRVARVGRMRRGVRRLALFLHGRVSVELMVSSVVVGGRVLRGRMLRGRMLRGMGWVREGRRRRVRVARTGRPGVGVLRVRERRVRWRLMRRLLVRRLMRRGLMGWRRLIMGRGRVVRQRGRCRRGGRGSGMQEPYRPRGSGDTGALGVRRTLVHAGHYIRRHIQPAVWRTPSYRSRGGGRGLARGNSAGLAHETTTAFQRRGDTMEPERREVDGCVRSASGTRVLTGEGDQNGAEAWGRGRGSRQLCDPMRTRGQVVRTTGDELAHGGGGGGDGESRRGGRDEPIGLAGAWTRLGGDSFGRGRWRQWARSGRTGLRTACQLPGCQPGCWDLELHASPGSVLDSLDQTGRRVGQQRGEPGPYCGRTGYGMQSASLFLLGLGGGRLRRGWAEGVPVSNERSSIAGSVLTTAERSRSCSRRRR